jgi:hypothetical protein
VEYQVLHSGMPHHHHIGVEHLFQNMSAERAGGDRKKTAQRTQAYEQV